MDNTLISTLPAASLQSVIAYYWLGYQNTDSHYTIWPDSSVDIVLELGHAPPQITAFGTTNRKTELSLTLGNHYLGIRFKPGKIHYLLDLPAHELTNQQPAIQDLVELDLALIAEAIENQTVFQTLNQCLAKSCSHHSALNALDAAIVKIETCFGACSINTVAAEVNKSLRQFERQFQQYVGLSAKQFAAITRFRRAAQLIQQGRLSLAEIAAELHYSDQSHLHHEFKRFTGLTPTQFHLN
ncbi:AraC family transcriptional regulator [uncultured Thiothrix sp.]|uniref:helix-turn-helix domain-containing protein n=1 Tax=uncultured Thiothrix sp. TaxID=223185 RepID=UPI00261C5BDA|nr:helix-turn-helix transcriptional regulator [uncultured Thiothrix sp.]